MSAGKERLYRPSDIYHLLDIHPDQLRDWRRRGFNVKSSGKRWFDRNDLAALWLAKRLAELSGAGVPSWLPAGRSFASAQAAVHPNDLMRMVASITNGVVAVLSVTTPVADLGGPSIVIPLHPFAVLLPLEEQSRSQPQECPCGDNDGNWCSLAGCPFPKRFRVIH